jgi:type II secretory pathway component PulK
MSGGGGGGSSGVPGNGGNPAQNSVTNTNTTNTSTTAATTPSYTYGASAYSPQQIQSAIDTSRQQGFSDQDIMTGLGRYNVPNNVAANSVYGPQRIQSAIDTSRQQGFSNQDILTGLSRYGVNSGPQQNAVMAQVSGARPSSSDSQFYQPVYQGQYQNYANPLGAFNTSTYGTNAGPSNAQQYANLPGGIGQDQFMRNTQNYASNAMNQPGGADMNRTLQDMRTYGMSPQDMQSAYSYGAPQQTFTASNPFNAYTGSAYSPQQVQNAVRTSQQQGFSSQDIATGLGRNGVYLSPQQTQMYNPFTQLQQSPSQTQVYSPQQIQSAIDTSRQQGFSNQDIMTGLGRYNVPSNIAANSVYGTQSSYQPMSNPYSYGGQQTYGGFGGQQTNPYQQNQQSYDQGFVAPQQPVVPTSSGPTQAIYGRSSSMRGTPNVMRRAEGGIIDLMEKK